MTSAINYPKLFVFLFLYLSCGIFFLPYIIEVFPIKATCIFSSVTGHPSPTCGTTRSLVSLLHLNPILAFQFNPLAALSWLVAFFVTMSFLLTGKPDFASLPDTIQAKRSLIFFFALFVGMNWFYLFWHEDFLKQNSLTMIPLIF